MMNGDDEPDKDYHSLAETSTSQLAMNASRLLSWPTIEKTFAAFLLLAVI